jgi:broad specificity phosphatase PhoE
MNHHPGLLLFFETHSTTLDNEAGLASGHFDVELSGTGVEQARTLGLRHQHDELAAVFCSDLRRAFRAAEIAFADRALSIVRDARLRECDYGRSPAGPSGRSRPTGRATSPSVPRRRELSARRMAGRSVAR